jgi:hypothetical protein
MNEPVKSKSPEIEKKNLYFIEKGDNFERLVVQVNNENILEKLIIEFINNLFEIEILIKITNAETTDEDIWKRYYGKISKENLLIGITKYHNFLFHDGYNEFLVKNSLTDEYICLDEYGILFYYLKSFEKIEEKLQALKFGKVFENSDFIPMHFCYRMELYNQREYLKEFIEEYNLKYGEKI